MVSPGFRRPVLVLTSQAYAEQHGQAGLHQRRAVFDEEASHFGSARRKDKV